MMLAGFKMAPPTPMESIEQTRAAVLEVDAYERLPQIKCPMIIVHGEKDVLVPPENALLIKSRVPLAELFMIAEAGYSYPAAPSPGNSSADCKLVERPGLTRR